MWVCAFDSFRAHIDQSVEVLRPTDRPLDRRTDGPVHAFLDRPVDIRFLNVPEFDAVIGQQRLGQALKAPYGCSISSSWSRGP